MWGFQGGVVKVAFIWDVTSLDTEDFVKMRSLHLRSRKVIWGYTNDIKERSRTYSLISVSLVLRLFLCRKDKCSLFPRDVPNRTTSGPSSCLLYCGVNMRAYEKQNFSMYFAFLLQCSLSVCFRPSFFYSHMLSQVVGC